MFSATKKRADHIWYCSPFREDIPNLTKVPTRYSPVRRGPKPTRLACLRHAASVHPEPGSNSSNKLCVRDNLAVFSYIESPAKLSFLSLSLSRKRHKV